MWLFGFFQCIPVAHLPLVGLDCQCHAASQFMQNILSKTKMREFVSVVLCSVQGAPWSWKVMENDDNVMEFLLLH